MTLTECMYAYENNEAVRIYVDKYARCHRMTVEDTIKAAIVQAKIKDEVKGNNERYKMDKN